MRGNGMILGWGTLLVMGWSGCGATPGGPFRAPQETAAPTGAMAQPPLLPPLGADDPRWVVLAEPKETWARVPDRFATSMAFLTATAWPHGDPALLVVRRHDDGARIERVFQDAPPHIVTDRGMLFWNDDNGFSLARLEVDEPRMRIEAGWYAVTEDGVLYQEEGALTYWRDGVVRWTVDWPEPLELPDSDPVIHATEHHVVFASATGIHGFDAETGDPRFRGAAPISGLWRVAPDEGTLAWVFKEPDSEMAEFQMAIADLESGEVVSQRPVFFFTSIPKMAYSPDGAWLLWAVWPGELHGYDVRRGQWQELLSDSSSSDDSTLTWIVDALGVAADGDVVCARNVTTIGKYSTCEAHAIFDLGRGRPVAPGTNRHGICEVRDQTALYYELPTLGGHAITAPGRDLLPNVSATYTNLCNQVISADGQWLAVGEGLASKDGYDDVEVLIYQTSPMRLVHRVAIGDLHVPGPGVFTLEFGANQAVLIVQSSNTGGSNYHLIDLATGALLPEDTPIFDGLQLRGVELAAAEGARFPLPLVERVQANRSPDGVVTVDARGLGHATFAPDGRLRHDDGDLPKLCVEGERVVSPSRCEAGTDGH